jgi:hypothetical protein
MQEYIQVLGVELGKFYGLLPELLFLLVSLLWLLLGFSKGQKTITTPITFAASANCVRYCDGEVVFSDIDSETYLLDVAKVEALLKVDASFYLYLIFQFYIYYFLEFFHRCS